MHRAVEAIVIYVTAPKCWLVGGCVCVCVCIVVVVVVVVVRD